MVWIWLKRHTSRSGGVSGSPHKLAPQHFVTTFSFAGSAVFNAPSKAVNKQEADLKKLRL